MIDMLHNGVGFVNEALAVNRFVVGGFFALTGAMKLYYPAWRASLAETFKNDGIPFVKFNTWWVPSVEFSAGCAVVIGLLTPLAALGLIFTMMVALYVEGRNMVKAQAPESILEAIDDCAYLPEVLYICMLGIILAFGPGAYSLDALIR